LFFGRSPDVPRAKSVLAILVASRCSAAALIDLTPTHLIVVSGANQSGDVAPLAQLLVVQALMVNRGLPTLPSHDGDWRRNRHDRDAKATVTDASSTTGAGQTATSLQLVAGAWCHYREQRLSISGTVSAAGGLPPGR
jgi:hypothetical protein